MHFPVAGIDVSWWVPPLVAMVISFFTSMGGVSGAFLLLPFQMSVLGYTHPSVSATNQLFNVVAVPSGVFRYVREGRLIWPLSLAVTVGTVPGVLIGALVRVTLLPSPGRFKLFVAGVLLFIAGRLVVDVLRHRGQSTPTQRPTSTDARIILGTVSLRRVSFDYDGTSYSVSTVAVAMLCFIVGIVGGAYGIGGGSIVAPVFVTFMKLPVYTVAGAALLSTFVTSLFGVLFFIAIQPFYPALSVAPDFLLGVLFGVGGMVGMYVGARTQKRVKASAIKAMLAGAILFTSGKYLLAFFQ